VRQLESVAKSDITLRSFSKKAAATAAAAAPTAAAGAKASGTYEKPQSKSSGIRTRRRSR